MVVFLDSGRDDGRLIVVFIDSGREEWETTILVAWP